jgi:HK97 gp10 family phage protein
MAGFSAELPNELIKSFQELENNTEEMLSEMTRAGAEVVYKQVKANMKNSFKSTESLDKGLKITKSYRTPTDDGINTKVGFYGYNEKGVPIPLIAMAREFGTSRGEKKNPFFRKAFRQESAITNAMMKAQEKYITHE